MARPRSRWVRLCLHALLFLGIGEALVRFDAATLFFQSHQRLLTEAKPSDLLTSVANKSFVPAADELRILLLGDSLLYGGGVATEELVTTRLRRTLEAQSVAPRVRILDLTRPGNNTYANKLDYLAHADTFQPQLVMLVYNANDVYGRMDSAAKDSAPAAATGPSDPQPDPQPDSQPVRDKLDLIVRIRRLVYQSKLLQFALQNLNTELKLAGFVVADTEFGHQLYRSHSPKYPGWIASQRHLRELMASVQERQSRLLVLNFPELNMQERYDLFQNLNRTIAGFFTGLGAGYIELGDEFAKSGQNNYSVSRYDGHPNGNAHEVVARAAAERIAQMRRSGNLPLHRPAQR